MEVLVPPAAAAFSHSNLLACRLAAQLGGGNLVAPAQRVTDFLAEEVSRSTLPTSSYRFDHNIVCLYGCILSLHSACGIIYDCL